MTFGGKFISVESITLIIQCSAWVGNGVKFLLIINKCGRTVNIIGLVLWRENRSFRKCATPNRVDSRTIVIDLIMTVSLIGYELVFVCSKRLPIDDSYDIGRI